MFGETQLSFRYLIVIGALGGLGAVLSQIKTPARVQDNEAMVLAAWLFLFTPVVMSFPMMASGLSFLDALFEAISGLTTTGLSTLATVENRPVTFLFSRAWMQWYGGLGIVVLSLALIVRPGITAKGLAAIEMKEDDLVGGTKAYALGVLKVYSVLTFTAMLSLLILGAKPFDAVIYSLAAVSTGSFSPHDDSIAGLGDWPLQAGVIFFSLAGAVPLTFYSRRGKRSRPDTNFLQVLALVISGLIVAILLGLCLRGVSHFSWNAVIHHAPILAFSAQTTAGFAAMDLARLDDASKLVLILAMGTGGGIGSTAGGFKILRLLMAIQLLHVAIMRISRSKHAVIEPRLGGHRMEEREVLDGLLVILLFTGVILLSWLAFLAMGYPVLDSLFEVVSATGTVGLSTGVTSSGLPFFLKGILCLDMLLGRLEIIAWIIFFNFRTWIGRRLN